jgi:hypothetical protein
MVLPLHSEAGGPYWLKPGPKGQLLDGLQPSIYRPAQQSDEQQSRDTMPAS